MGRLVPTNVPTHTPPHPKLHSWESLGAWVESPVCVQSTAGGRVKSMLRARREDPETGCTESRLWVKTVTGALSSALPVAEAISPEWLLTPLKPLG